MDSINEKKKKIERRQGNVSAIDYEGYIQDIVQRELQMTTDGVYTISILLDSSMDISLIYCSICHINKE